MIRITKNEKDHAIFKKDTPYREEKWFGGNCSDENLLKELGREDDKIKRVKWEDGKYMADTLHIYFEL